MIFFTSSEEKRNLFFYSLFSFWQKGSDFGYISDKPPGQTMAEKDMALIRSKRATNGAGPAPGAPKGKYRKRSVSLFASFFLFPSANLHPSSSID